MITSKNFEHHLNPNIPEIFKQSFFSFLDQHPKDHSLATESPGTKTEMLINETIGIELMLT